MIDDLRSDDGPGGVPSQAHIPRHQPEESRPFVDREVPLGRLESTETRELPRTIHAWLDGELPEASVRRGETSRDVEFWNRIGEESERRRRMHTPAYLEAQIMQALPQTAPAIITPWYEREFVIKPTVAVSVLFGVAVVSAIVTGLVVAAQ